MSPHSLVYHYHAGTFRENSPVFLFNVSRSLILFMLRHGTFIQILFNILKIIKEGVQQPKSQLRNSILKGFLNAFFLMPKMMKERWNMKIQFKILLFGSNSEIIYANLRSTSPKRVITIYSPHLRILGGGEKSAVDMADYLGNSYSNSIVCLVTDEKRHPTLSQICEQFGSDLPENVVLLSVPSYQPRFHGIFRSEAWGSFVSSYLTLRKLTKLSWLFVNHSPRTFLLPNARHNYYVVMYPFAGQTGSRKERRSQLWLTRWINKKYTQFICNSNFTMRDTLRIWKPRHPCAVVYPFFEPLLDSELKKENFEEKILSEKFSKDSLEIVAIGRFTLAGHGKNQNLLLKEFAKLNRLLPKAKLTLIGNLEPNNRKDEEFFQNIKDFVAKNRLNVEILSNCPRTILESVLKRSVAFWSGTGFYEVDPLPNFRKEHFGIVLIEAMRYGLVPFAFNDAGPREIIEHDQSGFLINHLDDLSKVTDDYFKLSEERRRDLAVNALRRSREFSKINFWRSLDNVFTIR